MVFRQCLSGKRKLVHDVLLNCIEDIINVLSEPSKTDLFYGLDNAKLNKIRQAET